MQSLENKKNEKLYLSLENFTQESQLILKFLVCTLCNKVFFQPVSLSCGHCFCKNCFYFFNSNLKKPKNSENPNNTEESQNVNIHQNEQNINNKENLDKSDKLNKIDHIYFDYDLKSSKNTNSSENIQTDNISKKQKFICPIHLLEVIENNINPCVVIEDIISKSYLRCRNFNLECDWLGQYSDLQNHLENECKKEYHRCKNIGCNKDLLFPELKDHQEKECSYRSSICNYCKENFIFNEINLHLEICEEYQVECFQECGTKIPRKLLNNHIINECGKTFINCPFSIGKICLQNFKRSDLAEHLKYNLEFHNKGLVSLISNFIENNEKKLYEQVDKNAEHISNLNNLLEEFKKEKNEVSNYKNVDSLSTLKSEIDLIRNSLNEKLISKLENIEFERFRENEKENQLNFKNDLLKTEKEFNNIITNELNSLKNSFEILDCKVSNFKITVDSLKRKYFKPYIRLNKSKFKKNSTCIINNSKMSNLIHKERNEEDKTDNINHKIREKNKTEISNISDNQNQLNLNDKKSHENKKKLNYDVFIKVENEENQILKNEDNSKDNLFSTKYNYSNIELNKNNFIFENFIEDQNNKNDQSRYLNEKDSQFFIDIPLTNTNNNTYDNSKLKDFLLGNKRKNADNENNYDCENKNNSNIDTQDKSFEKQLCPSAKKIDINSERKIQRNSKNRNNSLSELYSFSSDTDLLKSDLEEGEISEKKLNSSLTEKNQNINKESNAEILLKTKSDISNKDFQLNFFNKNEINKNTNNHIEKESDNNESSSNRIYQVAGNSFLYFNF